MTDFRFHLTDGNGNMICEDIKATLADEQSANDFVNGMRQLWRKMKYGERLNINVYKLDEERRLLTHWLYFSEF